MENIKIIHALCGCIVGIAGLLQIILTKKGLKHRLIGRIYFYTWLPLIISGAVIGSFLVTLFGIFGFYMVLTGVRFAMRKNATYTLFDKALTFVGMLGGLSILAFALYLLYKGSYTFAIVSLVFGLLFSTLSFQDYGRFIQGKQKRKISGHKAEWFFEHFTRMYISYIAAITAFTAIQQVFPLVVLDWLMPTVIGTILIFVSGQRYRKKMNII